MNFSLRMKPEEVERLKQIALAEGVRRGQAVSMTDLIREAIYAVFPDVITFSPDVITKNP